MTAPTYPLAFPSSPPVQDVSLKISRGTTIQRSKLTGSATKSEQSYTLWVAEFSLTDFEGLEDARAWKSFIAQLHGRFGSFLFPVPGITGPSTGYSGSAGVVNGGSQTGYSLVTDGWTNSATVLNIGDYLTVNNELKIVTALAVANGSGELTIQIEPALRTSPANNAAIETTAPYAVMESEVDDPGWNITPPYIHAFSITALESFS